MHEWWLPALFLSAAIASAAIEYAALLLRLHWISWCNGRSRPLAPGDPVDRHHSWLSGRMPIKVTLCGVFFARSCVIFAEEKKTDDTHAGLICFRS
jgi:hypothetical protein